MGRPRANINDLKLSGSHNLLRAMKYDEKKLTSEQIKQLKRVDSLIDDALTACSTGQSVGPKEKRNPAFQNLVALYTIRRMITRNASEEEEEDDVMKELDDILKSKKVS
jgi:hypothetical protein